MCHLCRVSVRDMKIFCGCVGGGDGCVSGGEDGVGVYCIAHYGSLVFHLLPVVLLPDS